MADSKSLKILDLPLVRVSAAALAIIRDDQRRYALLINKNRSTQGTMVLTPVGGAIEATAAGKEQLMGLLEITEDSFEKGNDLRFKMPGKKANIFREWFLRGDEREVNPAREIREELVDESELLENTDLIKVECNLAGYGAELAETTRTGQEGVVTLRLLEAFEVCLESDAQKKLVEISNNLNAGVRFVTEQEIRKEQTEDGVAIGSVALLMLDLTETIPSFS